MPSTKRTSPASSQATTTTAEVEHHNPGPPAARQHTAHLPRTHDLIIDAVTAMLTTGGHTGDVDLLLTATMRHTRRRTFSRMVDDREMQGIVQQFIRTDFSKWKADLTIAWRQNQRAERPAFDPQTITERIRQNVREECRDGFEAFMSCASFEEIQFLYEVLNNRVSRNHPAEMHQNEVYIASAFEVEANRDRCHLRLPEDMVDQVQKYIDALVAIQEKAA